MATAEVAFPLLPGNQDPFRDRDVSYPLSYTFLDDSCAPLFTRGVVTSLELEEIAQLSAERIAARCAGQRLLVVQILEGARVFARMLLPHLNRLCPAAGISFELAAIQVRSYSHGSHATAHQVLMPLHDSRGRELADCRRFDGIVLVDDLIDAGNTMAWLIGEYLPRFDAKGIGFCTMLDKQRSRDDMVEGLLSRHLISSGQQVPEDWLVGYGLDMALPGRGETPTLHLFRQPLPGGVYAFNSAIEERLVREYQQKPTWLTGQLAAYHCPQ